MAAILRPFSRKHCLYFTWIVNMNGSNGPELFQFLALISRIALFFWAIHVSDQEKIEQGKRRTVRGSFVYPILM